MWVGTSQSNIDLRNFKNSQMFQKLFKYIDHNNNEGKSTELTICHSTQFSNTHMFRPKRLESKILLKLVYYLSYTFDEIQYTGITLQKSYASFTNDKAAILLFKYYISSLY